MQKPVFEINGLTKVYGSGEVEVRALDGVDMTLYEGELAVLLGPSGSGKSTLLNIVGGLDQATSGTVFFDGRPLTGLNERELTRYRREHVGFVFQFYNLIPSLTARENVALVTEISRAPMSPDDALAMVNLSDRATHFPAQLSGGEQ
ncbi:MAG: ATP-binding cassette domain-containing protein, partial [Gammaproteobacteria bacterium]